MKPAPAGSLLTYLSQVPDPRGRQGRRHCLEAMLASVVCAMLQGARSYTAITQWIHDQDVELWHALGFTRRPPKLGAFRKLLMTLPPQHFEQVLADWAKYCLGVSSKDLLEAVAMDGKTLCGTLQTHERAGIIGSTHGLRAEPITRRCQDQRTQRCLGTSQNLGTQRSGDYRRCDVLSARGLPRNTRPWWPLLLRGERQPANAERIDCRRISSGFFPRRTNGCASRILMLRKRSASHAVESNDAVCKSAHGSPLTAIGRGLPRSVVWFAPRGETGPRQQKSTTPLRACRVTKPMRLSCSLGGEAIGASKTACITFVMSRLEKMLAKSARVMPRRI